eukprot:CAMPEP_0195526762 /NCGR_PEP_ID=MMETSP0794_2-20130614/28042_1 /TAXON_ID=515487 /ORGANISM="Stephanopyxis turris, Strain CCMP 815" /LENGTH=579 /DNA_ID=CAMNT_0040657531 /DNA_START=218 /DNA_END=1954 /DNA_ORIENTATION=+
MTSGKTPFSADDEMKGYENILSGQIPFPPTFSPLLVNLLKKLMNPSPSKRFGRTKEGTRKVMHHTWYSGFDFDCLRDKTLSAPFIPIVRDFEDDSCMDEISKYDDLLHKDVGITSPSKQPFVFHQTSASSTSGASKMFDPAENCSTEKGHKYNNTSSRLSDVVFLSSVDQPETNYESFGAPDKNDCSAIQGKTRKVSSIAHGHVLPYNQRQLGRRTGLNRGKSYTLGQQNQHHMKLFEILQKKQNRTHKTNYEEMSEPIRQTIDQIIKQASKYFSEKSSSSNAGCTEPNVCNEHSAAAEFDEIGKNKFANEDKNPPFIKDYWRHSAVSTSKIRHEPDYFLALQLMNLSLSVKAKEQALDKSCPESRVPFRRFSLLSVGIKNLLLNDLEDIIDKGTKYFDPFVVKSAHLIDQFPSHVPQSADNDLSPDALSVFCFPDGLKVRIIPRCAVEGAKKLGWLGKKADSFQLHVFTSASGELIRGIAITTKEELFDLDQSTSDFIAKLKLRRQKRKATNMISGWWRKCCDSRGEMRSKAIKTASRSLRLGSTHTRRSQTFSDLDIWANQTSRKQSTEAFDTMKKN